MTVDLKLDGNSDEDDFACRESDLAWTEDQWYPKSPEISPFEDISKVLHRKLVPFGYVVMVIDTQLFCFMNIL